MSEPRHRFTADTDVVLYARGPGSENIEQKVVPERVDPWACDQNRGSTSGGRKMDGASSITSDHRARRTAGTASSMSDQAGERELARWGGAAGLGGVSLMLLTFAVVIGLDLPDASDPETLTDFANIETGRIFEHLFYLGALVLFTLHVLVLYQLLKSAHWAAALFGTALSTIGVTIMSASSLLHVSTSPLADLYTDPSTPSDELPAIEYAWHGTQSVFDSMLATGLVLAPIGMVFLGVAMQRSRQFGPRLAWLAIGLGVIGALGATVEVVDPTLELSPVSVLALVVFHGATGWRTLHLANSDDTNRNHPGTGDDRDSGTVIDGVASARSSRFHQIDG